MGDCIARARGTVGLDRHATFITLFGCMVWVISAEHSVGVRPFFFALPPAGEAFVGCFRAVPLRTAGQIIRSGCSVKDSFTLSMMRRTVVMLLALVPLFALAERDPACDRAQEISFAQTRALVAPSPGYSAVGESCGNRRSPSAGRRSSEQGQRLEIQYQPGSVQDHHENRFCTCWYGRRPRPGRCAKPTLLRCRPAMPTGFATQR